MMCPKSRRCPGHACGSAAAARSCKAENRYHPINRARHVQLTPDADGWELQFRRVSFGAVGGTNECTGRHRQEKDDDRLV